MRKNVISYPEDTAAVRSDSPAYADKKTSASFFSGFQKKSKAVTSAILKMTGGAGNVPVAILLPKSVDCLTADRDRNLPSYSSHFFDGNENYDYRRIGCLFPARLQADGTRFSMNRSPRDRTISAACRMILPGRLKTPSVRLAKGIPARQNASRR